MKSLFFKIFSAIVVSYLTLFTVSKIYLILSNSYKTEIVNITDIEEKSNINGIVYKNESIINLAGNKIIKYINKDGTKIGKNDKIAQIYQTNEDALKYENILNLQEELKNLENFNNDNTLNNLDFVTVNKQIYSQYEQFLKNIDPKKLGYIKDNKNKLIYYFNIRDLIINKKVNFSNSITKINNEIKKIESTINMPKTIFSEKSGYFVGSTDGLEKLCSIKNINNLNLEEFKKFLADFAKYNINKKNNAKIITSPKILLKAVIPTKDIVNRKLYNYYTIKIKETGDEMIAKLEESIINFNQKESLVIFEIWQMNEKISKLRKFEGEVIFKEYKGFKIPKNAIHTINDSKTGVYVIEGVAIKFKPVDIIFEDEDFAICSTKPKDGLSNSKYLKNLDKIIVKGKDLYDNKKI